MSRFLDCDIRKESLDHLLLFLLSERGKAIGKIGIMGFNHVLDGIVKGFNIGTVTHKGTSYDKYNTKSAKGQAK